MVRPAGARADRVRLARAADHRAARARAAVRAAGARARGRADRGLVGAAPARARARRAPALPGVLVRGLLGWDGDTDAVRGGVAVVPAPSRRACAACSAPAPAGRRSSTGCATCSTSGSPEAGTPPRLDLVEAAHALPDALLGRAHGGGADAGGRRAARHRGGLVGDPGARAQGAARHADGADRARRLPARGLPGRGARRRLAGRALHRHAAGARPGARGVRGRRRDLPGDRRERLLGDEPRHRPGEDPRALQRAAPAASRRRRRRARRVVVSVGRIDPLKDIHTLLRVAAETLRLVPRRALPALRRGRPRARRPTSAPAWRCTSGSGSATRFRFMGRTTDPNGAVRGADVVLMTSISEGLPMSVLEAMSQGRPVVSTVRRRRARRGQGLRRADRARRRPRARDGRRDAAAQPRPGVAARPARPRPARADLQRGRVRRGLPRAAAHADPRRCARDERRARPRARRLVEARLGRAAAGRARGRRRARGVGRRARAAGARDGARADAGACPPRPLVSARGAGGAARPPGLLLEGAAFLVTVVAIALWADAAGGRARRATSSSGRCGSRCR